MSAVRAEAISYRYDRDTRNPRALDEVSFEIAAGELIAILGPNGCGKSTLVKHLNAMLELQKGRLSVLSIDASSEADIWTLRRLCGMVFQNPDDQFVSSVVAEDVAFGLENYDTPEAEIPCRVEAALDMVGMAGFSRRATHTLSGGQKQRVALAGVLAVEPEIVIFDEATSMLDPEGRQEVLRNLYALHRRGKTVIMITHYVEESVQADRIFLMQDGCIRKTGTPRSILTDVPLLEAARLAPPVPVQIYHSLRSRGIVLPRCPLTREELVEELCQLK